MAGKLHFSKYQIGRGHNIDFEVSIANPKEPMVPLRSDIQDFRYYHICNSKFLLNL